MDILWDGPNELNHATPSAPMWLPDSQLLQSSFHFALFERLIWPSPLVRERACIGIARLLRDPQEQDATLDYLLRWLEAQTLESVVALGLMALIRADHDATKAGDNLALPLNRIGASVRCPSLLSWMLLEHLGERDPWRRGPIPASTLKHSGDPRVGFEADEFFQTHWQSAVPPIYKMWAARLEQEVRGFERQWAFEWHEIVAHLGVEPDAVPLEFWMAERGSKRRYWAVDLPMSEIYRSAYLRALSWANFKARGRVGTGDLMRLACETCPQDLALWALAPQSQPDWWPTWTQLCPARESGQGNEDEPQWDEIWKQIERLWNSQNEEFVLGQASGLVMEIGSGQAFEVQILGAFGPKSKGASSKIHGLSPGTVFDGLHRSAFGQVNLPSPLYFQGDMEKWQPKRTTVSDLGLWPAGIQLHLRPAAIRLSVGASLRWQFWRVSRGIWGPLPDLAQTLPTFAVEDESLVFRDPKQANKPTLATWNDWTSALSEIKNGSLPFHSGQSLKIARATIERFEQTNECQFFWSCRISQYHRKSTYDNFKIATQEKLFGLGRTVD